MHNKNLHTLKKSLQKKKDGSFSWNRKVNLRLISFVLSHSYRSHIFCPLSFDISSSPIQCRQVRKVSDGGSSWNVICMHAGVFVWFVLSISEFLRPRMFLYIITGALPAVQQLPPQQLPPQPPALLLFKMNLTEVSGALASLSGPGGFRRFMKSEADRLEIVGSIQRVAITRAELTLVCTLERFQSFLDEFIQRCVSQGLFQINYAEITQSPCLFPPPNFQILRSESRYVKNGPYSETEFDCQSTTSAADREVGKG